MLEVDFLVGKKQLKQILEKVINIHGATKTAEVLDNIKSMGYKYSTRAAMTVSISDIDGTAGKTGNDQERKGSRRPDHPQLQAWSDYR